MLMSQFISLSFISLHSIHVGKSSTKNQLFSFSGMFHSPYLSRSIMKKGHINQVSIVFAKTIYILRRLLIIGHKEASMAVNMS